MLATLHVMRDADYESFLSVGPQAPAGMDLAAWGAQNFQRIGCTTCHHVDQGGGTTPGPNLYGVAGHQVELEGGASVLADDAYIEQSIRDPQSQIVRSYTGTQMSHFRLGDAQIQSLVAYINSLH